MSSPKTIAQLLDTLPQVGRVEWIGVRGQRRAPVTVLKSVRADVGRGLVGDRYAGRSGKRQVTLVQHEHLPVIASMLRNRELRSKKQDYVDEHVDGLNPAKLRRNISVSGINLLALKGKQFVIGDAVLEYTGLCHPCSFMEKTLGAGGYNAVRGHGGITARVVASGVIGINDTIFKKAIE